MLRNIAAALRPDGIFLMQDISGSSHLHEDIDHPFGPFLYTISCMHCMSVSLANGGPGLGAMWGKRKALEMLHEAGLRRKFESRRCRTTRSISSTWRPKDNMPEAVFRRIASLGGCKAIRPIAGLIRRAVPGRGVSQTSLKRKRR